MRALNKNVHDQLFEAIVARSGNIRATLPRCQPKPSSTNNLRVQRPIRSRRRADEHNGIRGVLTGLFKFVQIKHPSICPDQSPPRLSGWGSDHLLWCLFQIFNQVLKSSDRSPVTKTLLLVRQDERDPSVNFNHYSPARDPVRDLRAFSREKNYAPRTKSADAAHCAISGCNFWLDSFS